jgi:methylmalonyl-CoA mutase cobalamin-binding subunit
VNKLLEEDLPALNKKMNEAGVPHIVPNLAGGDAADGDEIETKG